MVKYKDLDYKEFGKLATYWQCALETGKTMRCNKLWALSETGKMLGQFFNTHKLKIALLFSDVVSTRTSESRYWKDTFSFFSNKSDTISTNVCWSTYIYITPSKSLVWVVVSLCMNPQLLCYFIAWKSTQLVTNFNFPICRILILLGTRG